MYFEFFVCTKMASRLRRNYLTLKKMVEVIEASEKNRGMHIRELAQQFECGKPRLPTLSNLKSPFSPCTNLNVSRTMILTARSCGR